MAMLHRLIFAVLIATCQSFSDVGSLSADGKRGRLHEVNLFQQQPTGPIDRDMQKLQVSKLHMSIAKPSVMQ